VNKKDKINNYFKEIEERDWEEFHKLLDKISKDIGTFTSKEKRIFDKAFEEYETKQRKKYYKSIKNL